MTEYNNSSVIAAGRVRTYASKYVPISLLPLAPSNSDQQRPNTYLSAAAL